MQSAFIAMVLGAFVPAPAVAQHVTPRQVDKIFAAYAQAGSPGCSLGVIRNEKFVYRKSYGEASLEFAVPLSSQSVFYMGSVSKQFTAASVVLAAEQGFLSLDDDVRKYVPELPDYGHTITLRQMLHHTSGLRDFFGLVYFSGHDPVEINSPDDILRLITHQKALNNMPGDEFVYSNTNYFLLGMVVQRATKKSLADFAARTIFRPLGMTHTRFYDDPTVMVPGRVAAYAPGTKSNFLVDWSTTYDIVGGGGLMSTVDDLLLWDRNFYTNRLGKGTLLKELQTHGVLNNGNQIGYALGLELGNYRGLPIVEHDGALFGYRTAILRFPRQKFSVICLCNLSSASPSSLARKVADLYLAHDLEPGTSALRPSGDKSLPDPAAFAGKYLDPRTHMIYSFTASGGNLMAWGAVLRRISANQYYDLLSDVITFKESDGSMRATLNIEGEAYFAGARIREVQLNQAALAAFAGEYRSTEVDATYKLSIDQGSLTLRNRSNQPIKLVPIANDEFASGEDFAVVFQRDGNQHVSGMRVFANAARGIEFDKIN